MVSLRVLFFLCSFFLLCFSFSDEKRFRDYLEEAEYYKENRQYLDAASAYKQLLRIDPKNLYYLRSIAKMYVNAGENELAISYYQRLIKLYPEDYESKFELGQLLYRENDYIQATPLLEEVVENEPENFRAIILLVRIFSRQKNDEKTKYYLAKAEAIDKGDEQVWRLSSAYHLSKNNYSDAYKYLFNTSQIVSSQELNYLVWNLRPYIYPSASFSSSYFQERERDLSSKLMTTEIDTWNHTIDLTIPVTDLIRVINRYNWGDQQQINLINGTNNYFVGVFNYMVGVEVIKDPHIMLKIYSNQKWGKDKPPTRFPYFHEIIWEPSVSLRYSNPNHLTSVSAYKDSYLGRHFDGEERALFIRRKLAEVYYEFRDSESLSSIGILANAGSYRSIKGNFRKLVSMWARYDVNPNPFHMVFEYKYEFSTFKHVDPDYSCYRAGYIHQGKLSLIRSWKNQGFLDCNYTLLWNRRRDLINTSVAITSSESTPNELRKNIYTAHIIECVGNKTLGNRFNLQLKFYYYMDSNDYRTAGGRLGLQCIF